MIFACSFTRERVRQMLEMITQEPSEDADRERGHSMPFHSDMIFQLNKTSINARFFKCDQGDQKADATSSVEKK